MSARLTMKQVKGFLRTHGVSPNMIDAIRVTMIEDAVQNGKDIQADRIYTMVALMLNREFKYGYKRILRGLKCMDEISGEVSNDDKTWAELMEELEDNTGIVIRTNEDNRITFEYVPKGDMDGQVD